MAVDGRDAVLFLDRNRLFIYSGGSVLKLEIPINVVRDLDVIDKTGLDSLIDTFVKAKKLESSRLWLVLADAVCFTKDFTQPDPVKLEGEIKDFLEAVPFDQIISKRYRAQRGIRVIVTNLELVESISEIFEKVGFSLEGLVPGAIFPGFNTKKILDLDFAKYILENKNLIRQGDMLQKVEAPTATPETLEPARKSRLLPFLLAGFAVLLIVLLAVILMRR